MHISEQVANELENQGWKRNANSTFTKIFKTGGEFGKQNVILQIDQTGRWFEKVDGWGHVEKDVDLRNFDNPKLAIEAVLK